MTRVPIARALIKRKLSDDEYEAVAIELSSHHNAVATIAGSIFKSTELTELVKRVAQVHDKYKPVKMKVKPREDEGKGGSDEVYAVGFEGHPYLLSFSDLEDLLNSPKDIAVAMAIGRLHHFINVRDVNTFIHTMALAKSYLDYRGVYVSLRELKQLVLKGLLLMHVADMIAGFIESELLKNELLNSRIRQDQTHGKPPGEIESYDTESMEIIEPHLPLTVLDMTFRENAIEARMAFHNLEDVLSEKVLSQSTTVSIKYTVCSGTLISGGRAFESEKCEEINALVTFTHKSNLIKEKILG